ncbi:cytochrome o ubiquinol oxidase subunit III [Halomonas sp. HP20-15]|uniref:cytochrome o ubiquinol oxidase subunit III n=1 Tax=Halomonas sp. HP20-15 TaxID=3085901 RepID=UPI002981CBC5|nr:cytochrome o ubiquinol oxidase subunit III [Halomonas sp. HP20-15]MDW5378275.1 cytochrome o ubiquinol oxidase subunit III [Halomonas sp. HP20-15]
MATDTLSNYDAHAHEHEHHDAAGTKVFGFWIYLMSDLVIFGSLFAAYAVLHGGTAGGPTSQELFELPFVLVETFLLLLSSFTYGIAVLAMNADKAGQVRAWLAITFLLGAGFVGMEIYEFQHLIHEGYGPDRSAFLSSFFTLVGTHGLHVSFGLLWILIMFIQVSTKGLTEVTRPRIMCLSLFWHFLDIVWICVFTLVYLMGAL